MKRFALVLLLALVVGGCGSDDEQDAGSTQPIVTVETNHRPVTCSTSGLRQTLPEQELPAAVADVRERVFEAALACDYPTLEEIALEEGEGFTFSYGATESAAEFWREREEAEGEPGPKPMRALTAILAMPYTRNEAGSYAWPTAYQESPTDADWQAIVDAGLYTQAQVDQMRSGGIGYIGYRTAITPDGDWQFFVAGD
jgi:hypothetical protein